MATGEGRLLPAELEDRLTVAFSARTHGQLADLVSDLPTPESGRRGMPIWARATLGVAGAVGVVTAAATAALLFSLIAGASGAWMLVGRVLRGRRSRRLGQARPQAIAVPRVTARRLLPPGRSAD